MKKNAFTLVEVLAIIAILGIMVTLVFPNLKGNTNSKKEKELEKLINIIENSGKSYFSFNSEEYKIRLDTLKEEEYLTNDLINPVTNTELDGCINVVLDENDVYDYIYNSCEDIDVPFSVELNGGNASQEFKSSYKDSTKIELIDPTHERGIFKGWKIVKGNSILKGNTLIIGTTETKLFASYEVLINLSLDLDGGTQSKDYSGLYKMGNSINLEIPTKIGYRFIGWQVTEGNSFVSGNTLTFGSIDSKLKAIWEINTYTISYNLKGGVNASENPESGIYGTTVTVNDPTKIGYTFNGWTISGTGSILSGSKLTIGPENIILTANWTANTYIVKLDANEGSFENKFYTDVGEHIYNVGTSGKYKIQVWGAQGGYALQNGVFTTGDGGYGGYSKGDIFLESGTKLYVNVGGKGGNAVVNADAIGGYNGGGNSWWDANDNESSGGGGGATHIAFVSGELSTLSNKKSEILIVAGGGGGGAWNILGGAGGGYMGTYGNNDANTQGTQQTGYSFGTGGPGTYRANTPGGGGGGGYYGGYGGQESDAQCGSGGSGYIGNSLLTNKSMYCYNCSNSTVEDTLTYSTSNISSIPIENYAKKENGAASISLFEIEKNVTYDSTYSNVINEINIRRDGYTFVGWKNGKTSGDTITSSTKVINPSNHTLYAQWTVNEYTITYNLNSGTNAAGNPTSGTYGSIKTINNPTRTGYTFTGWTVSGTGASLSGTNLTIGAGNITLTANWRVNKVYIRFNVNGGTVTASTTTTSGTVYNWTTSSSLVYLNGSLYQQSINYGATGNIYNYNNSTALNITRTGYSTTDGSEWICDSGCTTANKTFDQDVNYSTSDFCNADNGDCTVTLKVNWKVNTYTISYALNGGTNASGNPTSGTYGSTKTINNPTRTGYTFTGWTVSGTGASLSGTSLKVGSGNITLTANWRVNKVYIRFNVNGGTVTASTTTSSGTVYNWTTSSSLVYLNGSLYQQSINYGATGNVANYNNSAALKITKTGYTAPDGSEWICDSGCTTANKTFDQDVNYSTSDFCNADNGDCTVTLKVNWKANTYTINYYLGNGTSTAGATKLNSSTCTYNSSCTLKTFSNLGGIIPYSKEDNASTGNTNYGWVFGGWGTSTSDTSVNYSDGQSFTYTTSGNMNLYAIGRKSFFFNSGISPTAAQTTVQQYWNPYQLSTSYMSSISVPTATAISGWTFVGYVSGSNTASSTVTYASSTVGTNVTPAYNVWTTMRSIYKRTLTLQYNANGGSGTVANQTATQYYNSGYGSSSANTGANVSTPTFTLSSNSFTKTGYTFSKWADGSTSGTQYAAGASYKGFAPAVSNTTTSKTMYAIWNVNTYTISYALNGGTNASGNPTSGTYGSTKTVNNPTRTGYTFTGWTVSGTGASLSGTSLKVGSGNITLTANWRINKVYIRFHVNGGTITPKTTSTSGTVYNWTTSSSLVYLNGSIRQQAIDYGATDDLANYNNSAFLEIKKSGYIAKDGAEWICSSGCTTANKTYDHDVKYNSTDFCNAASGDCTVVLKVNWQVANKIPVFTYTGSYQIVDDNDNVITTSTGNWKIRFLTSGTLKITALNGAANGIDVFLVGGGGSGSAGWAGAGGGGGGGYTLTKKGVTISATTYNIVVGAGGARATSPAGNNGSSSSAFSLTANGGYAAYNFYGGNGGSGGAAPVSTNRQNGENGGSNGSNGNGTEYNGPGIGQGTTTREFGESSGKLYAGGGGSAYPGNGTGGSGGSGGGGKGGSRSSGTDATANTGGGGGGGGSLDYYNNDSNIYGGKGGSGIVIIRNKR